MTLTFLKPWLNSRIRLRPGVLGSATILAMAVGISCLLEPPKNYLCRFFDSVYILERKLVQDFAEAVPDRVGGPAELDSHQLGDFGVLVLRVAVFDVEEGGVVGQGEEASSGNRAAHGFGALPLLFGADR